MNTISVKENHIIKKILQILRGTINMSFRKRNKLFENLPTAMIDNVILSIVFFEIDIYFESTTHSRPTH
jgi:hypothetical protein